MGWLTPRRALRTVGWTSVGVFVFFGMVKFGGGFPAVSWWSGLLHSVGIGFAVLLWVFCFVVQALQNERLFYGKKRP